MSMKVAVFGGTGNIGRLVVDQLLARDDSVTMLVRDPAKVKQPAGDRLRVVVGGLDDDAALIAPSPQLFGSGSRPAGLQVTAPAAYAGSPIS
jgi:nucleoside-diphosphate-sugar epimerase